MGLSQSKPQEPDTSDAETVNLSAMSTIDSPEPSRKTNEAVFQKVDNLENNNIVSSDTSPFISTDAYNKIMKGGHDDSSDSNSDSNSSNSSTDTTELLSSLSKMSLTSTDLAPKKKGRQNKSLSATSSALVSANVNNLSATSDNNVNMYGFSNTSSEIIKTSENNYFVNNEASSIDTPYKLESSSINTSDINLVSVDSRHGRRFIQ